MNPPFNDSDWSGELLAKDFRWKYGPPEGSANFAWMQPTICLAESYGFNSGELNECVKVIEKNRELIERYWNEHFSN